MSLLDDLRSALPEFRGRLTAGDSLAALSWFRVGGPAEVMMVPADEDDLAYALSRVPAEVPVMPLGLGSNVILRDGGVPGVVVKLGRGFNAVTVEAEPGYFASGIDPPTGESLTSPPGSTATTTGSGSDCCGGAGTGAGAVWGFGLDFTATGFSVMPNCFWNPSTTTLVEDPLLE